jgi:hypothetical protein
MQAIPVYLHVFAVGNLDPGGAHSLAVGHLAEHKKNSRVHIQVMEKFAIELLSRLAAEQSADFARRGHLLNISETYQPIKHLCPVHLPTQAVQMLGTNEQFNRRLLSACSTHPTRRTTSLILTCTIRAFASGPVDSFASPI